MERANTKQINVGGVLVGGGAKISIQSMCTTKTANTQSTLAQIRSLAEQGCDIVRVAVANEDDADAIKSICAESPIPVVADIHFDYRLAVSCAKNGISKIRINPGNIGGRDKVREVSEACRDRAIPIRIGVNSGSLEKHLLSKYGHAAAQALVESAERHIEMLTQFGFEDICISLKSSSVPLTIEAYRLASKVFAFPLHLGVTETGSASAGIIKSAVGIGTLLSEGIGDTLRVSLTAPPEEEIRTAKLILKAAGLRSSGVDIISCPTCGRTEIDIFSLVAQAEKALASIDADITVAIMGCAVNGPGEAREADYGIAGGKGEGVLFKKGKPIKKVPENELIDRLLELIKGDLG